MINRIRDLVNSSVSTTRKPQNFRIFEFTKIINPEYLYVGDNVTIDDFCLLYAKEDSPIIIGSWVHIASYSSLTGGPIKIGNYAGIASGVRILGGSESYKDGAFMNVTFPDKYRNLNRAGCIFKSHSFVGANCVIYPGVTIGEGAVVGAASVVRNNLDDWGIYVMKEGKMVKINERNKNKTYENTRKLNMEYPSIGIMKEK